MEDRTRYTALWVVFTTVGLAGVGFGILAGRWESVGLAAVLMTASWVGLATAEHLRLGSQSGRPASAAEGAGIAGDAGPTDVPHRSRPLPTAPRQPVSGENLEFHQRVTLADRRDLTIGSLIKRILMH